MKEGEAAREWRELLDPLGGLKEFPDRSVRGTDPPEPTRRFSRRSLPAGPDHSLSVAAELTDSSASPALLCPALVEPDPETRLIDDELALEPFSTSFSLSFPSKPMNIRERASL